MKAPAFWYQPPGLTAYALAPFGQLYRLGGKMRRALTSPYRAKAQVVCVGNIVAGGAGKTPTALAIGKALLKDGYKPVFVTRGYGGRLRGPLRVDTSKQTAVDVGDEALLLAQVAPTWVGRNRAAAIRMAEKYGTHVILDDGLQNPSVDPDKSFLVINGSVGLGNEKLIPAGPLRETLNDALGRVSAVVMIGENDVQNVTARISELVLRARMRLDFPADFPRKQKFFAFAGIGHPEKFYALCRRAGLSLAATRDFPDHHMFTKAELVKLKADANKKGALLLTTEKDWVRLPPDLRQEVYTVPVSLIFDYPASVMRMLQL